MGKPKVKIVYAKGRGTVRAANGASVLIRWGEHWPANDPIVQAHPDLFTDDPTAGLRVSVPLVEDAGGDSDSGWFELARLGAGKDQPVEQATKAPGEKRKTRRPRTTSGDDTSST